MLINFCHWSMSPSVTSDKVSSDSFPVENLIAKTNPFSLQQGFITESFVRPPVSLVFKFPCNVIISKIILDPCVGAQKSRSVELWTETRPVQSSWLIQDSSNTRLPLFPESWSKIGTISMPDPGVVCFQNKGFYPSPPFTEDICSSAGDVRHMAELGCKWRRSLNSVSSLKIRVTQAVATGVAALKRVEVWGQPVKSLGTSSLQLCLDRFLQAVFPPQTPTPAMSEAAAAAEEQTSTAGNVGQVDTDDIADIPEDFLDALTWEVMAVPMMLPSGNNVDISTLDKHATAEAAWGRLPSDPFTGLVFNHDRQPVPNNCLKARIDSFLLKYSYCRNVKYLPRTVQTLHHSSAVWQPGRKRLALSSAGTEPPSERKRSRLILDDGVSTAPSSLMSPPDVDASLKKASEVGVAAEPSCAKLWQRKPTTTSGMSAGVASCSRGGNSTMASLSMLGSKGNNSSSPLEPAQKQRNVVASTLENFPSFLGAKSENLPDELSRRHWNNSSTLMPESNSCIQSAATTSSSTSLPSSEDIITAVLKNLPSYIGRNREGPSSTSTKPANAELKNAEPKSSTEWQCGACGKIDMDRQWSMYRLACKHIICRQCVLVKAPQPQGDKASKSKLCAQCGTEYCSTAIYRIH